MDERSFEDSYEVLITLAAHDLDDLYDFLEELAEQCQRVLDYEIKG